MQDVENWYEAEGTIGKTEGRVLISQKDREVLKKLCQALRRGLGIERCPIYAAGLDGYELQLPIDEAAKFVRYFKDRVKTKKARWDMEELEKAILRPVRQVRQVRRRARETLLFG
ncbi:MAG: hypothetical protein LYZ69_07200 [Nitrososphaerales archaeon]|nr:hypothetical protein [Nitrososphaerales archaeon]